MVGFCHALGSNFSEDMKLRIEQMHALGLSLAQIMSQHKQIVKELAKCNEWVTKGFFLLPSDVRNICKKRAEGLWEKHPLDPVSVQIWVHENPDSVTIKNILF